MKDPIPRWSLALIGYGVGGVTGGVRASVAVLVTPAMLVIAAWSCATLGSEL